MNKTYLILRHEFLHTVKRYGYIIMTLIVPLLALIGIGVGKLISTTSKPPEIKALTIGYVDEMGGFDEYIKQDVISLVPFDSVEDATQALI